jgi:hypothetical protein
MPTEYSPALAIVGHYLEHSTSDHQGRMLRAPVESTGDSRHKVSCGGAQTGPLTVNFTMGLATAALRFWGVGDMAPPRQSLQYAVRMFDGRDVAIVARSSVYCTCLFPSQACAFGSCLSF